MIAWYIDLVSPFAHLALPAIEALATRHSITVRPVVFGAILAHWGQKGPAEIPPKRVQTYQQCQFMAERMGMAFRFPPVHPFRSLDALRLLTALGPNWQQTRAVSDFIWTEGRDPGDPVEFALLCERLEVDPSVIVESGVKHRLRAATDAAITAGVFGVPTLAVDKALFWGLDAMPMAEAFLNDPGLLERGEMARLAALPVGVARAGG